MGNKQAHATSVKEKEEVIGKFFILNKYLSCNWKKQF